MTQPQADRRIERLVRRVRDVLVLRAGAEAFLVCALAAGALWLLPRLFDGPTPSAWWLLAPLPLALLWGFIRAWRQRLPRESAAAWLDRRLGLGGLLVTSEQAYLAEWQLPLRERLAAAPDDGTRLPLRAAAVRVVPAGAFLAALALLPQPAVVPTARPQEALAQQLERQELRLQELKQEGLVPEPRAQDLEKQLAELNDRLEDPSGVHWADADALDAELERSQRLAADALAGARDALDAYAEQAAAAPDAAAAQAALDKLLQRFGDDPMPALPAELAAKLGLPAGASPSAKDLAKALAGAGVDPAALARELADALDGRLSKLSEQGLADPGAARRLAAAGRTEREGSGVHKHGGSCAGGNCPGGGNEGVNSGLPGNGGISRGRADAELLYDGQTADSANQLPPEQLPATGWTAPDWTISGVQLVEPETQPIEDMSAGGAGSQGAGEGAWHRRLAPRHRAAVERFFSPPR
ncbi:MAG TPA: hypothetical protein VFY71_04090 [Planctomycetota bacterium]|nr:hypothetical protein [Planctomycetota bacterium]